MSVSQTRRMTTTKYDAAHYVVQLVRPTAYRPEGDTIYYYTLDPLPHFLQVLAISVCGNGAHILLGRHHVPTPRAYRPTRLWAVPRAVAAHRQSSLARGISHGVLGEKMAPVFPPLFRRVWFATGKEGSEVLWLHHGRLSRLGASGVSDAGRSFNVRQAFSSCWASARYLRRNGRSGLVNRWWVSLGRSGRGFGV